MVQYEEDYFDIERILEEGEPIQKEEIESFTLLKVNHFLTI